MFRIDEDKTIHLTRGDIASITVSAESNGEAYTFKSGDVVRFKVFERKNCDKVILCKTVGVLEDTTEVNVLLEKEDTKIGEVISKPTKYWYEVELNPYTNPQTIVGYDEDGEKVFTLYPEGSDVGC